MPGANYMGGKRNAARARVKDATGKVQRNHFGKKRFEILRTGLSKGQATTSHAQNVRGGLNPRAEISLAHAHRTQYQHDDDTQTWLPNAYDSSSPIGNARSTPALASGRSHILRVLDAENCTSPLHIRVTRRKPVSLSRSTACASRQDLTDTRPSRFVHESPQVCSAVLL
ncbi:hypothetical protein C8Q73DRAFT_22876 [Cubamyces lactineus]|nr:hypothetical protein C8Q73DRAFT_22876 [Cubamyces lactineus]